jgi:hypothetical protein
MTTHPEQGWSLLCNGVVVFDDYGELLPNGSTLAAPTLRQRARRRSIATAGAIRHPA